MNRKQDEKYARTGTSRVLKVARVLLVSIAAPYDGASVADPAGATYRGYADIKKLCNNQTDSHQQI
jgi:hypothetical protein